MKKNMIWMIPPTFIALGLLLSAADTGAATPIWKTATITVADPLQIGELTLQPGRYRVKHVAGTSGDHFLQFESRKTTLRVPCKIEPMARKVDRTGYTTRDGRIVAFEIRGELFRHVLLNGDHQRGHHNH
jgi:hypothetical protein